MNFQDKEFSKIVSIKSKKTTFIAKTVGAFIFVATISGITIGVITILQSGNLSAGFKLSFVVLSVILLSFLIYAILKDINITGKNKITKVVVDQNGLHHYRDEIILESLTFESLRPDPDQKNYDVVLSEGEDVSYDICVYYFDNLRNTIIYKAIVFNTPFSIANAKELESHFIKGVLNFRADLKVSPQVLDLLNLKNL